MDGRAGPASNALSKVALIDSDQHSRDSMANYLNKNGILTYLFASGAEALPALGSLAPDIIIIDPERSQSNGIPLIQLLLKRGPYGIIIVSACDDPTDRIIGLEVGADDYVCKPIRPREFLARLHAVHRRTCTASPSAEPSSARPVVKIGDVFFDATTCAVRARGDKAIPLTGAELIAFKTMLSANGQCVSREILCRSALRHPLYDGDRSIDKLIRGLRYKIAELDAQNIIHTVRGDGYRLCVDETEMALAS